MKLGRANSWTLGVFLGGVMLHADRIPVLYVLAALACCTWRVLAEIRRGWRLPSTAWRGLLALLLLAGVLMEYRTVNGLGPGTALLISMGSVKLLEMRARRDRFMVIGVALFLMLAACLDRQSIVRAPLYLALAVAAAVAMLYAAQPESPLRSAAALRLAASSFAWALPLAALLFVFFPRLPGQLWALPTQGSAITGLSDELTPGGISQLSESDDPAFRVRFAGAAPPPQLRYWRGPVLHDFDGYTWRRSRNRSYRQTPLEYRGTSYRYRVTLEPHQRNWWFALEMVSDAPPGRAFLTYDYQLLSALPVTQATTYELTSYPETRAIGELSLLGERYNLALPMERNRRSRQLAERLRAEVQSDEQFAQRVLDYFRRNGFAYTLTPEILDLDSVDDFLFNTRAGFCGHYASAFAMLMRAGGVPARVVTGYLGGEWNPVGGYYVVRQSDAHAWVEIWREGLGWQRVDPTAVVSPERLTRGLYDILPNSGSQVGRLARDMPWLQRLRQSWDAANAWWQDQIIEFDFRSQLRLLGRLGFEQPRLRQLGYLAAAALALWIAAMALLLARERRGRPQDPLAKAYRRLCRWAEKCGAARAGHEGPSAFAARLSRDHPLVARPLKPLLAEYAVLRYGSLDTTVRAQRLRQFVQQVRKLRRNVSTAMGTRQAA
jgi:transglutaminase-like putative cysteine protease